MRRKLLLIQKNTQVVYAPSISPYIKSELNKIFKDVAGIRNTTEYLSSFVQDQLRAYTDKICSLTPPYFIYPPYEAPSGFRRKYPNPLLLFLTDNHPEIKEKGALSILIAEPGQGKTYTGRYLASELCKQNMIPIYVNSEQWFNLTPEDLSSLWKTISYSFKYFATPIDWIEGCEQEFLQVTLKAGLFRIIFDGFDEYILWNRGKVDANETLKSLIQLTVASDSRILITSRTSFWYSEIQENCFEVEPIRPYIYKIHPFDHNEAKNYFDKRFPADDNKIKTALLIYSKLRSKTSKYEPANFAGRGFILSLIADLAERSDDSNFHFEDGMTVIQWIIYKLCEREVKRQNLPISAEQQIEIFRELAELKSCGTMITTEMFRDIIAICGDRLEQKDIDGLLEGSLKDHPLIRKDRYGIWDFVHEQVLFALLAEQILYYVEKSPSSLRKFFSNIKVEGSLLTDLSTAIVDQIFSIPNYDAKNKIKDVIRISISCYDSTDHLDEIEQYQRSLLTVIAMIATNRLCPPGKERLERTKEFVSYFPDSFLKGLHFIGTIPSMDFSGITFEKCRFDKVTWANCKFDETTLFNDYYFSGGKVVNCEHFGDSKWEKGWLDSEAKAMVDSYRVEAKKKQYTKVDLKRDIEYIINKFVPKESVGFKTVYEEHLMSGIIGHSRYGNDILDVLCKYLLEKHVLSKISGYAFNIKDSAKESVQHYINNGVFTGMIAEAYDEICKKLKL